MDLPEVTLSKIILFIIRFIFLPVKLIHFIVYGRPTPVIVGYSWYSKKDYAEMVAACDDDPDEIVPTHTLWLERATETIKTMVAKKWVVVKINIKTPVLIKWLRDNNLSNTRENREKYVTSRVRELRENGI